MIGVHPMLEASTRRSKLPSLHVRFCRQISTYRDSPLCALAPVGRGLERRNDGAYAVLGGRTGRFMSAQRIRLASRLSGLFLISGGIWLAFARAR